MRQPLGRETNTDAAFRDMTRPKVLKQPGQTIAPIKFKRAPAGRGGGEGGGRGKAGRGRR